MPDLREQLARRLHSAYWIEYGGHAFELGELDRREPIVWGAVADECLRQMEWARDEMRGSFSEPGREIKPNDMPLLTLAPEDWSPPKQEEPR